MIKKAYLFFLLSMGIFSSTFGQTIIKGTVVSKSDGLGIPRVAIVVNNSNEGAYSDFDGNFVIELKDKKGVLLVSSLGYSTKEVSYSGSQTLQIELEESTTSLDAVVVTALNIKRAAKTIGYATQKLKGTELKQANETNLVNALSGKIAGAQVTNSGGGLGSTSTIIFRGTKSLSGGSQPLFVIDGVPISNKTHSTNRVFGGPANPNQSGFEQGGSGGEQQVDFGNAASEINPADIESIQVLKGANAAALYGERASNGAILITTKKGKNKRGLGININSNFSIQTPLKTPKFQTEFGKGDNGLYAYGDLNYNVGKNFGPRFKNQNINQYDPNNPTIPVSKAWVNRLGEDPIGDFLEVGTTAVNGFSITNGNEKGNFRLSYTRFNQQGMVPNTDLTRNTIGLNASYNVTPKFKVATSVNYINSGSDNRPNIGAKSDSNVIYSILKLGTNESLDDLKNYWEPFKENVQQATADSSVNNPYFLVNENLNGNKRNRVFGNVNFTYNFTDYLSLLLRSGKDFYIDKRTNRKALSHVSYRNGFYSESNVFFEENNTDLMLNFKKDLNSDFSLSSILGLGRFRQRIEELRGSTGASGLVTPGFYHLSNSVEPAVAENYIEQEGINSIYGSATLGYKDYAFLDVTGRNDWSSTLPKGNNSYFYPSVSLSLILSKMMNLKAIKADHLKLRGSYAEVGVGTDPYTTNSYTFKGGNAQGVSLNTVGANLGNKNLISETVKSSEVGLETSFFRGRFGFDLTLYKSTNDNQIITLPLATESGFLNRGINIPGTITNKGVELTMNIVPVKTDKFKWDIIANWSKNVNKIEVSEQLGRFTLAERWINLDIVDGGSFGDFYGDYLLRVDENGTLGSEGVQIFRADGRSEESDDVGSLVPEKKPYLGNATPDWIAGINNSFTYKNINFSFLFDINKGGQVYSRTYVEGNQLGSLTESAKLRVRDSQEATDGAVANGKNVTPGEYWVKLEGATLDKGTGETTKETIYARTSNFYKRYYDNDAIGVFDRTFVKLREVKLTYNFPDKFLEKSKIKNVSIALFGRNLMLWDNVPHIDPETAGYSGGLQGGEYFSIPSARSFGMSLNVNF